jgi:hypothetical protein
VMRQKHVGGLQVPVNDAPAMEGAQRVEQLQTQPDRLRHRNRAAGKERRKRFAFQSLHRDEQLPVSLTDLIELTDVRVVDARREPGFPPESLARRVVGCLLSNDLQRDRSFEPIVYSPVHHAHSALTERTGDAISTDVIGHWSGDRNLSSAYRARGS